MGEASIDSVIRERVLVGNAGYIQSGSEEMAINHPHPLVLEWDRIPSYHPPIYHLLLLLFRKETSLVDDRVIHFVQTLNDR